MVRFDAYTATTRAAKPEDVLGLLVESTGGLRNTFREGQGFHSFGKRISMHDETGDQVGAIQYGGRQGDRVMLEVKGSCTPMVVEALRARWEHRCTRVDACADFERPGAFESILDAVMDVKHRHDLIGERRGDWEKPELGRTQYLGSPKSPVRARLYEKGKQPEYRHLGRFDLVRLEVQVRPVKDAKDHFSTISAREVWGASKWTRELAAAALDEQIERHAAGTVWKRPDLERRLSWIAQQAGPTLLELVQELGSWECLGLTLRDAIEREKRSKRGMLND